MNTEQYKRREYFIVLCIFAGLFAAIGLIAKSYWDMSRFYQNFTLSDSHEYLWFVNFFDYSHVRLPARSESRTRSVGGIIFYMWLFPILIRFPLFSSINKNRKVTKIIVLTIMTTASVLYHSMAAYTYFYVLKSPTLLAYTGLSFVLSIVLVLLLATYDDFFGFVRYQLK